MPFISKQELPVVLHAAYDKAAKGVDNDETRISGENNKEKIDSEKELLIFDYEVEKLKAAGLDKMTYDAIKTEIRGTLHLIKCDKNDLKLVNEYNELLDRRSNLNKKISQTLNDMSTSRRILTLNGAFCKDIRNMKKELDDIENLLYTKKYRGFGTPSLAGGLNFYKVEPTINQYW